MDKGENTSLHLGLRVKNLAQFGHSFVIAERGGLCVKEVQRRGLHHLQKQAVAFHLRHLQKV